MAFMIGNDRSRSLSLLPRRMSSAEICSAQRGYVNERKLLPEVRQLMDGEVIIAPALLHYCSTHGAMKGQALLI